MKDYRKKFPLPKSNFWGEIPERVIALEQGIKILEDAPQPLGIQGPMGPQGIQGAAGVAGPIGPAGLTWEGQWVSGTSYTADDAVGYGGASYFCILDTSGTSNPSIDTTHWALLASQGAVGPTGSQGPTGPQGLSSTPLYKVYTAILSQSGTDSPVATVLENTLGITPTWTRLSVGSYQFNAPGTLTLEKTIAFVQLNINQETVVIGNWWVDFLRVEKRVTTEGTPLADGLGAFIEIRVYN